MHHDDLLFAKKKPNIYYLIWNKLQQVNVCYYSLLWFEYSYQKKINVCSILFNWIQAFYSTGFKYCPFFSIIIQIHFKIGKYTKTEASIINEWIFFPFCWKRSCFLSRDLADLFDKKGNKKNKDNSPKNIPSAKINKQPYNDPNKYTFV